MKKGILRVEILNIKNNLMKLGRSLGNVPQKLKIKLVIKTRYISECSSIFKSINSVLSTNCTFENGLKVQYIYTDFL
jgi:hypothetical protein